MLTASNSPMGEHGNYSYFYFFPPLNTSEITFTFSCSENCLLPLSLEGYLSSDQHGREFAQAKSSNDSLTFKPGIKLHEPVRARLSVINAESKAALGDWKLLRHNGSEARQVDLEELFPEPVGELPNVVIYMVDAMRFDVPGSKHGNVAITPNMDKLAGKGLTFTNCRSSSTWTRPAVASIFTGLPPTAHLTSNRFNGLPQKLPTLAEKLKKRGYSTIATICNKNVGKVFGFSKGFDDYKHTPATEGTKGCEGLVSFMKDFVSPDKKPFFAFVHACETHVPYVPAPEHEAMFMPQGAVPIDRSMETMKRVIMGQMPLGHSQALYLKALYNARAYEADICLGSLMELLGNNGLLENTLFVVTSDHGDEFLEHGEISHGGHLYDNVLRIPLILSGAGLSNGKIDVPFSIAWLDKLIFAALSGHGSEGDETAKIYPSTPIYASTKLDNVDVEAVVQGEFKLIHNRNLQTQHQKRIKEWELYNLAEDPGERNEIERMRPITFRYMKELLEKAPKPPAGINEVIINPPKEVLDQLKAIGYF